MLPTRHHFIAMVEDLTDMLDYGSKDIDGMDDDAGDEQEPPPTGRWTATSSYDIYMVDTPKEGNGDKTTEDDPSKKQPKCRRQWRCSKSRQSKSSVPAQEIITLRIVPKTIIIPSSMM